MRGLEGESADFVREQQPYSHHVAAETAQVQRQFDRVARQRDLQAEDLRCHETGAYSHILRGWLV